VFILIAPQSSGSIDSAANGFISREEVAAWKGLNRAHTHVEHMMRMAIVAGVVGLSFVWRPQNPLQQSSDPVNHVLTAARHAVGGDARLEAAKNVSLDGPFRRQIGTFQAEGNAELLIVKPDRMRRVEELELASMPGRGQGGGVERTSVLSGDDAWEQSNGLSGIGSPPGPPPPEFGRGRASTDADRNARRPADFEQVRTARMRAELENWLLALFLRTERVFTLAGVTDTTEGKADVLATTDGQGDPIRLLIDQQTHLPVGLTFQDRRPMMPGRGPAGRSSTSPPIHRDGLPAFEGGGRTTTVTLYFSKYREEAGLTWPHQIDQAIDNVPTEEWTIRKYRINVTIKPDLFKRK
jgi:hypothetical protein